MSELIQYGVTVRTLSDYVDRFCLKQGNMREAYYTKFLVIAEDVWKDMYRNTIWNIKRQVLDVCKEKHTVRLPDNCERVINISVIDHHNQLHPLTLNTNHNTAEILCDRNGKCSCKNCEGKDTLCPVIDNLSVTTEYVTIQGNQYPLTTWIRYNPDGSLQTEQSIPAFDTASQTVIYQTKFTKLCNLDITSKGCIKPTKPNMDLLRAYCGWDGMGWNGVAFTSNVYRSIIPATINYWGEYNYNAADPLIVHIYHGHHNNYHDQGVNTQERHHFDGIKNVILTFKTNGDIPGQEILIPEYAQMAMDFGMIYQQRSLNPKDGDKQGDALRAYKREKNKIFRYLNPVTMQTMQQLQQAPHRW